MSKYWGDGKKAYRRAQEWALNSGEKEDLRVAMAAIGSYVTNLVTLDGVILALTVSVYPKKFAGATELVFAVIGWIFLVISIVCGIMANATQVDLLTESKLKPRGGALEAQARRCVISFALGAIALGVYGFLIRYNS